MRRSLVAVPVLGVSVLALGACSSGSDGPDFAAGWEWAVNSDLAYDTDREFDYSTGEIGPPKAGEGLSLPGADDDSATFESVEAENCERFVGDYPQWVVSDVLSGTLQAWERPPVDEKLQEAFTRINEAVTAEAGSEFDVEMMVDGDRNPEYDRIVAERETLTAQAWEAEPEDVRGLYQDHQQNLRDRWGTVYNEDGVRQAQETVIEACEIEAPADYVFPTAKDLEIDLTYPLDRP